MGPLTPVPPDLRTRILKSLSLLVAISSSSSPLPPQPPSPTSWSGLLSLTSSPPPLLSSPSSSSPLLLPSSPTPITDAGDSSLSSLLPFFFGFALSSSRSQLTPPCSMLRPSSMPGRDWRAGPCAGSTNPPQAAAQSLSHPPPKHRRLQAGSPSFPSLPPQLSPITLTTPQCGVHSDWTEMETKSPGQMFANCTGSWSPPKVAEIFAIPTQLPLFTINLLPLPPSPFGITSSSSEVRAERVRWTNLKICDKQILPIFPSRRIYFQRFIKCDFFFCFCLQFKLI